jgi:glycogen(starch) synthase
VRIAYITHEYPPDTGFGGIGTYTLQMALGLKSLDIDVEIFSASYTKEQSHEYMGILTHRVKINSLEEFRLKIVSAFSERHENKAFDIIECPEIGGEAWYIKEKYPDLPLIVRLHTPSVVITRMKNSYVPLIIKLRFVLGALIRGRIDLGYWSRHDKNQSKDPDFLITEKADVITAPSEFIKRWATTFWRIDPARIQVVPNPISIEREEISPRTDQTKSIIFLGRLNVLKGIVSLTEAIPLVLKRNPEWRFCIIGKDEASHKPGISMKEWMISRLDKYLDHIDFVEWASGKEKINYLKNSEIVVIPSLFESFSYVCVEAMSLKKAVIGSKGSAMEELLADNAGILIHPRKSRKLARSINRLIENPKLRSQMGSNARNRTKNEYERAKVTAQMIPIYKMAIRK